MGNQSIFTIFMNKLGLAICIFMCFGAQRASSVPGACPAALDPHTAFINDLVERLQTAAQPGAISLESGAKVTLADLEIADVTGRNVGGSYYVLRRRASLQKSDEVGFLFLEETDEYRDENGRVVPALFESEDAVSFHINEANRDMDLGALLHVVAAIAAYQNDSKIVHRSTFLIPGYAPASLWERYIEAGIAERFDQDPDHPRIFKARFTTEFLGSEAAIALYMRFT